jgi:hypothetical protein
VVVSDPHLSDETLLLLNSRELPEQDDLEAAKHLARCEPCRRRFEDTCAFLNILGQTTAELDRNRFEVRLRSLHRQHRWKLGRFVRPAGAFASATATGLIAVLIWNSAQPTVSAEVLVQRAITQESEQHSAVQYIRISDGEGTCTTLDPACARIRTRLKSVNWDLDRPLSAKSFERWRASLTAKHETVSVGVDSLNLRTSTTEGPLHSASLRVRRTDFHALSTELDFGGSEPIVITEIPPPATVVTSNSAPMEVGTAPGSPRTNAAIESELGARVSQLDETELQVRSILHQLNADLGYESIVDRHAGQIEVYALVRDEARRDQLKGALSPLARTRLRIKTYAEFEAGDDSRFPKGETGNSLPPLAEGWLKAAYPDWRSRSEYINRVTRLSTQILGEAETLEELRRSSAAEMLSPIRQDHEQTLASLLTTIEDALVPLTGPLGHTLTMPSSSAQILDSAVTRLLSASRSGAGTFEDELDNLRTIFNSGR